MFGIGKFINNLLDKFLPDIVGDVIGAVVDGLTGNYAGAATNALDAVEDVFEYAGADRAAHGTQAVLGFTEDIV
ncbi:MAG: hypothetical protein H6700_01975 [Myxococcales bacterium]|nr:hypothetical protein [Myxococcales bacterium]MCB9530513.1 hypothetical protein [Myxococcales bacterium]